MEAKLKLITTTIFLIIITSCFTAKKSINRDYYVSKSDFIDSYKTAFICGCVNGLTNSSLNTFMAKNNDNGLFADIELISLSVVKEADSIGRLFSTKLTPINYEDAGFKKPIVGGCIKLALSKEVDKIAYKRYKQLYNLKK